MMSLGGCMKKSDIKKEIDVLIDKFPAENMLELKRTIEEMLRKLEESSDKMTPKEYQAWMDSLPEEDEELSEECLRRIEEGKAAGMKGEVVSHQDVKRGAYKI